MPDPQTATLQVALPLPLPMLFDYSPPAGQPVDPSWVGRRVRVPFGRRRLVGVIAGQSESSGAMPLREVEAVLDDAPLLPDELWQTLQWAAGYYLRPFGDVWATALPLPLRRGDELPATRPRSWRVSAVGQEQRARLRQGSAPRRLADLLAQQAVDESTLAELLPDWRPALRSLVRRGLVEAATTQAPRPAAPTAQEAPPLNPEQRAAVEAILAVQRRFQPLLLDGVTGSGKTEVYLAAIAACLARGRQALVLVPEIGLTPQALQRYRSRLPVAVVALHSGLADGERARAWTAMARGEARVMIGTRSAIFTPLPEPGIIIVDEEHDASYKQQDGFRYHARDLALVRAKTLGIPVLLGSATPALETLLHARSGRYTHLRLASRAGGALPPAFHLVDVRSLPLRDGLSAPLLAAIGECLARGEQALVFRNRRGYAPCLLCHDCGWTAHCVRCDAAMTLHGRNRLVCHHCGARRAPPSACPECSGLGLMPQGAGTERLEQGLARAFPAVPLVRVDRETTQHRDALAQHFARLGDGPGILVGTQMLAKGHDLPRLTTVAIASIDDGLFSADYRAPERLAQLLIQVSGRAGRARRPGRVWLQTHHPQHPLLATLLQGGYAAFADVALAEREAAGFPPYAHLALLRADAATTELLDAFLQHAFGIARHAAPEGVEVHPPMPAPMPLRDGRHRGQVLFVARRRGARHHLLHLLATEMSRAPSARKLRWSIDVDPVDLY